MDSLILFFKSTPEPKRILKQKYHTMDDVVENRLTMVATKVRLKILRLTKQVIMVVKIPLSSSKVRLKILQEPK